MEHESRWHLLPVEVLAFMGVGHAGHVLAEIPPWLGSAASALCVGVALRLLDHWLKRRERIAARRSDPPPPPPR